MVRGLSAAMALPGPFVHPVCQRSVTSAAMASMETAMARPMKAARPVNPMRAGSVITNAGKVSRCVKPVNGQAALNRPRMPPVYALVSTILCRLASHPADLGSKFVRVGRLVDAWLMAASVSA